MTIEHLKALNLLIKLSEKVGNYKQADTIASKLVRFAQSQQPLQFTEGTELQEGQLYEVPTSDNSVFDDVAQNIDPKKANVGGENVWITHGSADGKYIVADEIANNFYSKNPEFKETRQLSEQDANAGIEAMLDQNNRLWLNDKGMNAYAGAKWIACYDMINGKGYGQYGGSKGPVEVITQTSPEGQQKTYLQAGS